MKSQVTKLQYPPELAKKEGVSAVTIRKWCEQGLIKGAKVLGKSWLIPKPAEIDRPKQGRPWPVKELTKEEMSKFKEIGSLYVVTNKEVQK